MGEMKHTPGPWTAHRTRRGPVDIFDPRNRDVVTVYGGGVEIEAREANAHLIAAAPDLRLVAQEALDTITDYLAYEHDGDPYREDARLMGEMDINSFATDGRLERLRAALSKAEGRSLSSASGQEGGE